MQGKVAPVTSAVLSLRSITNIYFKVISGTRDKNAIHTDSFIS